MTYYDATAHKHNGYWTVLVHGIGRTEISRTASRARRSAHALVVEKLGVDPKTVQIDIEFVQ